MPEALLSFARTPTHPSLAPTPTPSQMRAASFTILLAAAAISAASASHCDGNTACVACASDSTILGSCRWCPVDNQCHDAGSLENPCSSSIKDPSQCSPGPAPGPSPTPNPASYSAYGGVNITSVVDSLFKVLGLSAVDAATCVADVAGAGAALRDFASDFKARNDTRALAELSTFLSSLATAFGGCDVQAAATKIDALAAAMRWANVSAAKAAGEADKIIIGVADVTADVEAIASAVASNDTTAIGAAIGTLLFDWNTVTGGCGVSADGRACSVIEGLLRLLGSVASNYAPCELAVTAAFTTIEYGFSELDNTNDNATDAVRLIAKGLDGLAVAIGAETCGLKDIGARIAAVAPRLAAAVVKVVGNGTKRTIEVIIAGTDVYDELYNVAVDLERKDYAGAGMQLGRLVESLKATSCDSEMCTILEGLLEALALEAADFGPCSAEIDKAWQSTESAINRFRMAKSDGLANLVLGAEDLADAFVDLANAVSSCGIKDLSALLENTANELGLNKTAGAIGNAEQLLVNGADLTLEIASLLADATHSRWGSLGADLAALAIKLNGTKGFECHSYVCKVVDGVLASAGLALQDLEACEAAFSLTEEDFASGASSWRAGDVKGALEMWSSALNVIATAVTDDSGCGVAKELTLLAHEANVLGLANVTLIKDAEKIAKIFLHGANLEEELYAALQSFENHDARGAGLALGKILETLAQWTTGKGCSSSNACFVLEGIITLVADGAGSFKECEADVKESWGNLSASFHEFTDGEKFWHFKHNKDAIRSGVHDLGNAMHLLASSVGACHLQEVADLIAKLAAKLGIVPEISWVEELLHIVIESVHLENEIGDACDDYANKNYVGFGYNVARLIYTLVE